MLIVISPAKTLDYETSVSTKKETQPTFLPESEKLITELQALSPEDITELMHVSSKIAELNFSRFLNWEQPLTSPKARQAIFAFKGDVYTGIDIQQYKAADLEFAQKHLRILSGLYGLLRPLDLMLPYRLEMGTRFANSRGENLYKFWGEKLSEAVNQALEAQKDQVLVNLASNEYFKALKTQNLNAEIVTPVFKDYKNGQYKVISFFAKKARGLMASYILLNRIKDKEGLSDFAEAGYRYSKAESTDASPVFLRKQS